MKRVESHQLSRKAQRKASSAARPVKVQTKIRHSADRERPRHSSHARAGVREWYRLAKMLLAHGPSRPSLALPSGLRQKSRLGRLRVVHLGNRSTRASRRFPERHASTAVASRSRPPGPATRTRTSSQLQTKIPSPPRVGFGAAAFRVDRALGPRTRRSVVTTEKNRRDRRTFVRRRSRVAQIRHAEDPRQNSNARAGQCLRVRLRALGGARRTR